MESDNFYIIGGDNEKVSTEINENSKVVFIDKEQEKFRNKYSLIKDFQDKQSVLREKWLSFQEEVFKKIQTFLNKDDDFSYLLSSIFFEASPNKTNSIYKFFKLKLIIDYIKKENIKNVFLYNVSDDIKNFFYSNTNKLNISVKTLKVHKEKTSIKKKFKALAKKYFITFFFYHFINEYKKKRQKISSHDSISTKVVLSYYYPGGQSFNNGFSSKYFESVSSLLNVKYDWLFLYVGNFFKLGKEDRLIRNNITSFGFLDAYFAISDFKEIILHFFKIRKKLKSIKVTNLFTFENIDYLSLTKSEWLTSTTISLFDLLIFEKKISNFFKKNSQIDEAIYLMEFQPWEQIFNKVAKKYNVKTKGVIHSVVRSNVMNYCHPKIAHQYLNMPSFVGVNSEFSRSLMIKNGFTSDQILKIEAQRYNYLSKNQIKVNSEKIKLRKSILIVTSIIYAETKELLEFFASTNIEFEKIYIKEHHLFRVSSIIKSSIKNFPSFEIVTGSMPDVFQYSDIVYTANGSSVLLESVLNKKQTISLISLSSLPIPSIQKASNLHLIYDVNSLSKILNQLISEPVSEKSINDNNNYLYLDDELNLWREFIKK